MGGVCGRHWSSRGKVTSADGIDSGTYGLGETLALEPPLCTGPLRHHVEQYAADSSWQPEQQRTQETKEGRADRPAGFGKSICEAVGKASQRSRRGRYREYKTEHDK
jgi:hypothetical protein